MELWTLSYWQSTQEESSLKIYIKMKKYNELRQEFEESYQNYLKTLEEYNAEYERGKRYVLEHKKSYRELTEKATRCSNARIEANSLWNICLSHPLHRFFKGYSDPLTCKYGIK